MFKNVDVFIGDLFWRQPFAFGALLHLVFSLVLVTRQVADVGIVADEFYVVPKISKRSSYQVSPNHGAEVANMLNPIDGRTAVIKQNFFVDDRFEVFETPGQGVINLHRSKYNKAS